MKGRRTTTPSASSNHLMASLRLDRESPLPLHAQVEKLLRELIRRPELAKGGLLPDEVRLASRLGVSRGTLRAGISRLVHDGLLERKSGVGTRVALGPVESVITAWQSFSKEMEKKGIQVETFLLECKEGKANPTVAAALRVETGTTLLRLDRIRGWDGTRVVHSRSWFHPRLGLTGSEDFNKPLYEAIEAETGAVPTKAHEEFFAVLAPSAIAQSLQVARNTPLLARLHTVYDSGGRPLEYAEVYYRSEKFHLTLDLRLGT